MKLATIVKGEKEPLIEPYINTYVVSTILQRYTMISFLHTIFSLKKRDNDNRNEFADESPSSLWNPPLLGKKQEKIKRPGLSKQPGGIFL